MIKNATKIDIVAVFLGLNEGSFTKYFYISVKLISLGSVIEI